MIRMMTPVVVLFPANANCLTSVENVRDAKPKRRHACTWNYGEFM